LFARIQARRATGNNSGAMQDYRRALVIDEGAARRFAR